MRVDNDGCDLVEGDDANGQAVFFDLQKATIPRQMAALLGNIYDLIQCSARKINLC